jgi:hypothetical protein
MKRIKYKGVFENEKILEIYATSVADAIVMIQASSILHWKSQLVTVEDTYHHKKYNVTITVSYEEV